MKPMDRLSEIAGLVLELRLAELRRTAEARDRSLARIAALNAQPSADPDPMAAAMQDLRYQLWADARRAEINTGLARQTAEWMEAREEARLAFGKAEVLKKLRGQAS